MTRKNIMNLAKKMGQYEMEIDDVQVSLFLNKETLLPQGLHYQEILQEKK